MFRILFISLALWSLAGCSSEDSSSHATVQIPSDVTYSIIDEEKSRDVKRRLNVRLNKGVSEKVLESISHLIIAGDTTDYERTFILYYLPDMEVGSGAWANASSYPNLNVSIFGVTPKEEDRLRKINPAESNTIVGAWFDRDAGGGKMTIFNDGSSLFLEQNYPGGGIGKWKLEESEVNGLRRFDQVPPSGHGDHFIINSQGNLKIMDDQGLIKIVKKL